MKPYVLLLFLLLYSFSIEGQSNDSRRYTSKDGLLSSDNYMTLQDKKGFIWISSKNGLVKYDGLQFQSFTVKNGLPINDIWYMKEDQRGRIWLGGYFKGLYYIENDLVVKAFPNIDYYGTLFTSERGDTSYFYSSGEKMGFYSVAGGDFVSTQNEKKERYSIFLDEDIEVIPANDINLKIAYFKSKKWGNKEIKIEEVSSWYASILQMNRNVLALAKKSTNWIIATEDSLYSINIEKHLGKPVKRFTNIVPKGETIVWFEDELRVYKNIIKKERDPVLEKKLKPFLKENISWVTKDLEGNLWTTIYRSNIVFIPAQNHLIDRYNIPTKSHGNNIWNILKYEDKLFCKTLTGKLHVFEEPHFPPLQSDFPLMMKEDKILHLERNQSYFAYTADEYLRRWPSDQMDKLKSSVFKKPDYLYIPRIFSFLNDSVFIDGNFNQFVIRGDTVYSSFLSKLNEKRVYDINKNENYFISSNRKGVKFQNRKTKEIHQLSIKEAQCISPFGQKTFIGTNGNGFFLIDEALKTVLQGCNELSVNSIEQYNGLLFLGTNKGIYIKRYDPITEQIEDLSIINIYDGLSSNEVNDFAMDKGKLYVATIDGFNVIDIESILDKNLPKPLLYLNKILVNDQAIPKEKNRFHWDENNIEIQFSGISFHNQDNLHFLYRLKGIDQKWVSIQEPFVKFRSLSPGNYTFEVKAINHNQITSENTLSYQFKIQKHYTGTWWFSGLFFLGFLGFTSFFVYQFLERKNQQIASKRKMADLEMKALQSQMNPHFIFNSLNAIQSVMFLKGEKETNKYIGDFSKLMRLTLDNSKSSTLSLKDELIYLKLYIDLEKKRLNDNLAYDLYVDPKIDLEKVQIPSMLFQPLVENSILHGLIPKKTDRQLHLRFSLERGFLLGEVADNGIGRKEAGSRKKGKNHRSWASTILLERIDVLNRLHKSKIKFQIIDLEEAGIAIGTKIVIKLPLDHEH